MPADRDTRERLSAYRNGITHKFVVGGVEGYIIANAYDDGRLAEIFLHGVGKQGSSVDGWANAFALAVSFGLQNGASLGALARKLAHMRFEPYGETDNPDIPWCASVPAYIFQWLVLKFGTNEDRAAMPDIIEEMRQA